MQRFEGKVNDARSPPHRPLATKKKNQKKLQEVGWKLVTHPFNSPDRTLSEYHIFRSLKNTLRNIKFGNADDLLSEIVYFMDSQSPPFWKKGIESMPDTWEMVIVNNGNYVID